MREPAEQDTQPGDAPPIRGSSLRRRIVGIALLVGIPLLLLWVASLQWVSLSYQEDLDQRMQETVRSLALALDREIDAYVGILTALSESSDLEAGLYEDFYRQAEAAAQPVDSFVVVLDRRLNALVDTSRPFGEPRPATEEEREAQRVFDSGELFVSDLRSSAEAEKGVMIFYPVTRNGDVVLVLAIALDPGSLAALMQELEMQEGAYAVLSDSADRIVAHSLEHERLRGGEAPGWLADLRSEAATGSDVVAGDDGAVQVAYTALSSAGWTLAVVEPYSTYRAQWLKPVAAIAIGGLFLLVVVAIVSWRMTWRLLLPLERLAENARQIARGEGRDAAVPPAEHTGIREFDLLQQSLRAAQQALRRESVAHEARAVAEAEASVSDAILRAVPLPMVYSLPDGRVAKANAAYFALLGLGEEQVVGRRSEEFLPPRIEALLAKLEEELFERPDEVHILELDAPAAETGLLRSMVLEIHLAAVRGPDGKARGTISTVVDLTDERRRQSELALQATTDPLTGLANRREFMRRLDIELSRAKRTQAPVSLILFDIDRFKAVNDQFGHGLGDEILRAIAALGEQQLRKGLDLLARIGGEEFAIVTAGSDLATAYEIAERLRASLAVFPALELPDGKSVTASFGVAELDRALDNELGIASAFERADAALYQAKAKGRNRVVAQDGG